MSRWGGVNHNNFIVRLFHDFRKGTEYGDFLCAGRAQIFLNIGKILAGQTVLPRLGKHFSLILFQLCRLVDVAHGDAVLLG